MHAITINRQKRVGQQTDQQPGPFYRFPHMSVAETIRPDNDFNRQSGNAQQN